MNKTLYFSEKLTLHLYPLFLKEDGRRSRDSAPGDASSSRVGRRRRSRRWLERDWSARRGHRVKRGIAVRSSERGSVGSGAAKLAVFEVHVCSGERFRKQVPLGTTLSAARSSQSPTVTWNRVPLAQDTRYPVSRFCDSRSELLGGWRRWSTRRRRGNAWRRCSGMWRRKRAPRGETFLPPRGAKLESRKVSTKTTTIAN